MLPVYTIIDFETTGTIGTSSLRAVEVAVLRVGPAGVEDRFVQLINPGCRIDYFSQTIHGIADAMVKDSPTFMEIWPQLSAHLDGTITLAHNAPFDAGVLRGEIVRGRFDVPRIHWTCSCKLSRSVWPELPSHKLGFLQQQLKLRGTNSHRALADAELTAELVERALNELQQRTPKPSAFDHLVEHGTINLKTSWRFPAKHR